MAGASGRRGLRRGDVFPITWRSIAGAIRELERARIPLHVVATDLLGAALVKLSSGPAADHAGALRPHED